MDGVCGSIHFGSFFLKGLDCKIYNQYKIDQIVLIWV